MALLSCQGPAQCALFWTLSGSAYDSDIDIHVLGLIDADRKEVLLKNLSSQTGPEGYIYFALEYLNQYALLY